MKKEAVTTSPSLLVTLLDKDSVIKKMGLKLVYVLQKKVLLISGWRSKSAKYKSVLSCSINIRKMACQNVANMSTYHFITQL